MVIVVIVTVNVTHGQVRVMKWFVIVTISLEFGTIDTTAAHFHSNNNVTVNVTVFISISFPVFHNVSIRDDDAENDVGATES